MFRRAASTFGKVAASLGGVQLSAAAVVALSDKELSKKPDWYQAGVRSLEDALKRLSKYGFIESVSALDEAHNALSVHEDLHNTELQWRIARVLVEKADLSKDHQKQIHLLHQAKDHAKKALAVEPARGSAGAHKWYAMILTRLAKLENAPEMEAEALQHLEKAAAIDPKDPYTLHILGTLQYQNKDYKEAVATLQKAEQIKAGFSAANLYYLGMAQKASGNKPAAIETLKKAYQTLPRNRFDLKGRSSAKAALLSLGVASEEFEPEDL